MSLATFSSLWYRVADLKPKIRDHIKIHRQYYRGQIWYVLQDQANDQQHRFNATVYQLIAMMNGDQTVEQIWETLNQRYEDDAPTQDETIQLLGELHAADAIQCTISPDSAELLERYQQQKSSWKRTFLNPLSVKIPLLDPDKFLNQFTFSVKPFFTKTAFLIWLLIVISALFLALSHWSELTENVSDRVLSANNLLLLALLYPCIKVLHELGHAFAVKVWGGEVHEMGIMFLVLIPNPYVNTTSAWSFPEKKKRIIVSAAGMMIELLLASLALFLWLNMEAGIVRALAFNTMIIASISTIFFNANPLLRFDGYYILSDLIEIPNLATRANKYIGYLMQRYLFGLNNIKSSATDNGERIWFVVYGVAAFIYRLFILAVIALFIAGKFFFIGVMLATWTLLTQLVLPIIKYTFFLLKNNILGNRRRRAISVSAVILLSLTGIVFLTPVPQNTVVEGTIWLPQQAEIRSETSGFIKEMIIQDGSLVKAGFPLLESYDPLLVAEENVQQSHLAELRLKLASERRDDPAQAAITKDEISSVEATLARLQEQQASLIINSKIDGKFVQASDNDLTGRYIKKGELIGYVIKPSMITARVVVAQKDIGIIRKETNNVEIKLSSNLSRTVPATIQREVPAASNQLPSRALGSMGGGGFAISPDDPDGLRALEKVFQFDIVIENSDLQNLSEQIFVGERVYAKFNHGKKPLAQHFYRSLRQLFLSKFDV